MTFLVLARYMQLKHHTTLLAPIFYRWRGSQMFHFLLRDLDVHEGSPVTPLTDEAAKVRLRGPREVVHVEAGAKSGAPASVRARRHT